MDLSILWTIEIIFIKVNTDLLFTECKRDFQSFLYKSPQLHSKFWLFKKFFSSLTVTKFYFLLFCCSFISSFQDQPHLPWTKNADPRDSLILTVYFLFYWFQAYLWFELQHIYRWLTNIQLQPGYPLIPGPIYIQLTFSFGDSKSSKTKIVQLELFYSPLTPLCSSKKCHLFYYPSQKSWVIFDTFLS